MTDTDKLIIARLLTAIDDSRKPERFRISVPPKFNELDLRLAESAAAIQAREAALANAMNAARTLIGWDDATASG